MNPEIQEAGEEAAAHPLSFDNKHPCSSSEVTAVKTEQNDYSIEITSNTEPEDLLAEDDTKTMFFKYGIKVFKSEEHDMVDESESVDVFQGDSANDKMLEDRNIEIEKEWVSNESDCDKEMDCTQTESGNDVCGSTFKAVTVKAEKGDIMIDETNQPREQGYFGIAEILRTEITCHDVVDSPLKRVIIKTELGEILEETLQPIESGDLVGVKSTNRTVQGGTTHSAEPNRVKIISYSVMDLLRGANVLNQTSVVKSKVPKMEMVTKGSSSKTPPKSCVIDKTDQQKPSVVKGNEQPVNKETLSSPENCENNILAIERRAREKLECPICLKKFQKPAFYVKHVNQHLEDGLYQCKDCSKIFKSPHRLRFDIETKHSDVRPSKHSDVRLYICPICKVTKGSSSRKPPKSCVPDKTAQQKPHVVKGNEQLVKSETLSSSENCENNILAIEQRAGEKFECPICLKKFQKPAFYVKHVNKHLEDGPYQCKDCSKILKAPHCSRFHIETKHSDVRPYICPICNQAFKVMDTLKSHMYTHTGKRKYQCTVCEKSFSKPGLLKEHVIKHSSKKNFVCNICHKNFKGLQFLKHHVKNHYTKGTSKVGSMKSKPQEKETEKEPTKNSKVLLRHLLTQYESFPFKCEICSKSFAMQNFFSNIREHMK